MNYFVILLGSILLLITLLVSCVSKRADHTKKVVKHTVNPSLFTLSFYQKNKKVPFFAKEYSHSDIHKYGLDTANNYVFNELIDIILKQQAVKNRITKKNITLKHLHSGENVGSTEQLQKIINYCLSKNTHNIKFLVYSWGNNLI